MDACGRPFRLVYCLSAFLSPMPTLPLSDAAKQKNAERRRLDAEMFSQQSDHGKMVRGREVAVSDIRRLKSEIGHLKAELEEREEALRKTDRDLALAEAEINHLKRRVNSL